MMTRFTLKLIFSVLSAATGLAQTSNIDPSHKFAYGENVGWTNWRDAGAPEGALGARVHAAFLSGFVWGENIGWINLGNGAPRNGVAYANATGSDFGVNIDAGNKELIGLAWGENIGWINFGGGARAIPPSPARISGTRLRGFAWGESVGWINLDDATHFVAAACNPCDTNCDGSLNQFDIQPFVEALLTHSGCAPCAGDTNADGSINQFDIQGFVACLGG